MTQGGVDQAWLSPALHRKIADWQALTLQAAARPTHLADIVRCKPTHKGFCNASGILEGGGCIYPALMGHNLVWRHPCTTDTIANLVSSKNHKGTITNSNLELSGHVLHEVTLLVAVPEACMDAPCSGSYNNTTFYWSMQKASTINLVVTDLLYIHALHSRKKY